MAAAGATGLDGVVEQVVGQPLEVAVAHEGVLGQVTARETKGRRETESLVVGTETGSPTVNWG